MSGRENFLSRWSRLKQEGVPEAETVAVETPAPAAEMPPLAVDTRNAADPAPAQVVGADAAGEPITDGDDTPRERHPTEDIDIDSLTRDSDFTVFLKQGVPDFVQQRALRKLWTLDPVFAQMDGLNDYENIIEEFGISDLATTDWKVGRGFLTDEDFAKINERGGYVPPEEREDAEDAAEEPVDVADEEAAGTEDPEEIGDAVETAGAEATGDDEFAVGDGDDTT